MKRPPRLLGAVRFTGRYPGLEAASAPDRDCGNDKDDDGEGDDDGDAPIAQGDRRVDGSIGWLHWHGYFLPTFKSINHATDHFFRSTVAFPTPLVFIARARLQSPGPNGED